jgi:hypothetical protein
MKNTVSDNEKINKMTEIRLVVTHSTSIVTEFYIVDFLSDMA